MSASILRARAGDRLLVRAHHNGENGAPPFVVRWDDDGHVSRLYPGTDACVQSFEHST